MLISADIFFCGVWLIYPIFFGMADILYIFWGKHLLLGPSPCSKQNSEYLPWGLSHEYLNMVTPRIYKYQYKPLHAFGTWSEALHIAGDYH